MFVSPAYAQAAGGGGSGFEALLPLVLIFVVFYFLLIRPQQKKMKAHKGMLSAIRRGDKVVTGGGIIGTVTRVIDDNELTVEIAKGVRVKVQRGTISAILAKTEPAKGAAKGSGKGGEISGAQGGDAGTGVVSGLKALLGGKGR
jgi:preprotein translocase subunit YajC